jgi:hypothetical protein
MSIALAALMMMVMMMKTLMLPKHPWQLLPISLLTIQEQPK